MKTSQLYHLVNEIIKKNKQQKMKKNENKHQPLRNFYKKFLQKNKLIHHNKRQKMRDIMKDFTNVDSYVDISDVIQAIHQHISKLMLKKQIYFKKKIQKTNTQPVQQLFKQRSALQIAENLLQKGYRQGKYLQLNNCSQIIQHLQQNSNQLNNTKYKNYSNHQTYHQILHRKYIQDKPFFRQTKYTYKNNDIQNQNQGEQNKNERQQDEYLISNDRNPWRILQQRNLKYGEIRKQLYTEFQDHQEQQKKFFQPTQKKLVNIFDQSKMLNSAAAFLHMILQRQHQKKWIKENQKEYKKNFQDIKIKKQNQKQKYKQNKHISIKIPRHKTFQNYQKDDISKLSQKNEQIQSQCKIIDQIKSFKYLQQNNRKRFKDKCVKTYQQINDSQMKNLEITKFIKQFKQLNQKIQDQQQQKQAVSLNKLIQKRVRHTLKPLQNSFSQFKARKSADKIFLLQKKQQKKELREKFTFKKRRIKQGVLKKITEFVNNVQHAQKSMIIQSKDCEKQLQKIQNKMVVQYEGYKSQKILNNKALDGVRSVLLKQNNKLAKYHKQK